MASVGNWTGSVVRSSPPTSDVTLKSLTTTWLNSSAASPRNTVAEIRAELEGNLSDRKSTRLRGKDGKSRPKCYSRIIANSDHEGQKALSVIASLPENGGKIVDTKTASRRFSKEKTRQRLEANPVVPLPNEAVRIYHSRFQDLEAVAGIEPDTVDLILTDIPYGKNFLPEVAELGAMGCRILKPGGLLVTYSWATLSGQSDRIVVGASELGMVRDVGLAGNATLCHPRNVKSKCSPFLVYSKGDWLRRGQWVDVLQTNSKEKDRHDWQKPLPDIERLLSYFSQPGDLVVDPCGGGFTTAIACDRLGRRCISCDCVEEHVVRGQAALSDDRRLRSGGNREITTVSDLIKDTWPEEGEALTSPPEAAWKVGPRNYPDPNPKGGADTETPIRYPSYR